MTVVVEVLRSLEAGFAVGASHFALPEGSQEIGLGLDHGLDPDLPTVGTDAKPRNSLAVYDPLDNLCIEPNAGRRRCGSGSGAVEGRGGVDRTGQAARSTKESRRGRPLLSYTVATATAFHLREG